MFKEPNSLCKAISKKPSLALYQPDIPQNTGAIIRLCACFDVILHIIEPAGFLFSAKSLNRSSMDYLKHAYIIRHDSFSSFYQWSQKEKYRLILATTKAKTPYYALTYSEQDIIIMGRESAGVPDNVHRLVHEATLIPLSKEVRSLNVAMSSAILVSEALRQTYQYP